MLLLIFSLVWFLKKNIKRFDILSTICIYIHFESIIFGLYKILKDFLDYLFKSIVTNLLVHFKTCVKDKA